MPKRPLCTLCLLLMAFLFLGDMLGLPLIRTSPVPASVRHYIEENPSSRISGEVDSSEGKNLVLNHARLVSGKESFPICSVKVRLGKEENFAPGTVLLLTGTLNEIEGPGNPGEFNFRQYYAARNIYYSMDDASVEASSQDHSLICSLILRLRNTLADALSKTAGSDAPLFSAIALGDRHGLSDEVSLLFQLSGILHILSISGLHISLLGISLRNLLLKAGAGLHASVLISLSFLVLFCLITGNGISALRAVIMYLVSSFGMITGRIYDMLSALSLAAILLLLERPACLFDTGFLLSFTAAVGAGGVCPTLEKLWKSSSRRKSARPSGLRKKVSKSMLLSFSVLFSTLPVTLYTSGEVSLAGIFLNLLAVPAAGAILLSAVGAMLAGCIYVPAGTLIALPGRALFRLLRLASELCVRLPFTGMITGKPSGFRIFIYYAILAAVLLFLAAAGSRKSRTSGMHIRSPLLRRIILGEAFPPFILAVLTAAALSVLLVRPLPLLSITCLDIGQGDSIVIRTPENRTFLVDGGSSDHSNPARYQLLPYLKSQGISHIDAIFVSHTDTDHISGILTFLEYRSRHLTRISADALVLPDWQNPPDAYGDLIRAAEAAGVRVVYASRGHCFRDDGMIFRILSPVAGTCVTDPNDDGMVMQAEYGDFSALFTGDISTASEDALLNAGLISDVDFLKAAHHGSRYSSGEAFLQASAPEIAVISCSKTNKYGHPAPEAVERLIRAGCQVEYTMKSGAVTVYVKSGRMFVSRFRNDSKVFPKARRSSCKTGKAPDLRIPRHSPRQP